MVFRNAVAVAAVSIAFLLPAAPAGAANVVINALAGFDDPTAATPIGGNTGTTVGEQREIAFQYAADLWGARLVSDVDIEVDAAFSSLSCGSSSGTLGSAGPNFANINTANLPLSNTWYSTATADARAGSNLVGAGADIDAEFNADIGQPDCLAASSWYYGLDGNPSGGALDFVTVLLHELGHGLGFLTFVTTSSGAKFSGSDDTYMVNLEDHSTGEVWPDMNNGERQASAIDGTSFSTDLHWTGAAVNTAGAIAGFKAGLDTGVGAGGHVEIYAPNPLQPGSSVSHYATTLSPNELMEPSYTVPIHELELSLSMMEDIGWPTPTPCGDADQSGAIVATDALIALRTAVGSSTCVETACDPTGDGTVTASDALLILTTAVAPGDPLRCGLSAS
jgi:hypothetical protein